MKMDNYIRWNAVNWVTVVLMVWIAGALVATVTGIIKAKAGS